MVANTLETAAVKEKDHLALIINPKKDIKRAKGKENIATELLKIVAEKIKNNE